KKYRARHPETKDEKKRAPRRRTAVPKRGQIDAVLEVCTSVSRLSARGSNRGTSGPMNTINIQVEERKINECM
ncbi:unnamed protein product, partial [Amoebophrya sp. A120]